MLYIYNIQYVYKINYITHDIYDIPTYYTNTHTQVFLTQKEVYSRYNNIYKTLAYTYMCIYVFMCMYIYIYIIIYS